jgi:hypothetical protein
MGLDYTGRLETSLVKAIELPKPKEDAEVMETYTEAKDNLTERKKARKIDIKMNEVESNNIREMGYHEESRQLRVLFTNGGLFQYKEVPPDVVSEMMKSDSVGSYFSKNVRTTFTCVKLN